MGSKKQENKTKHWNLETIRRNGRNLLVICPKCGKIGRLYFSRKIGWYVKHGSNKTHSVPKDTALEIPLHSPRLSLIRYVGGDTYLLPYLAKMIPPHEIYVEVFGGGAPLLLNKPPSKLEIYNDIDDKLVNLFMVVRDRYEEFIKRFKFLVASRTLYYEFIKRLDNNEIKDPIEKAVAYYYVIRLAYSGTYGAGLGFALNGGAHPKRAIWSGLRKVEMIWQRLKYVAVESLDFREILQRYDSDKTFFYVDPPHLYLSTEQNVKGANYYSARGFTNTDYMDLLGRLERIKGWFLLKQSTYIPWLIKWAENHNYYVVSLKLKKATKANPKAKKTDLYMVYFIANYKIITY